MCPEGIKIFFTFLILYTLGLFLQDPILESYGAEVFDLPISETTLLNAKWKFAKTMPWNPHSYTLKETWDNKTLFQNVVYFINDFGKKEEFKKKCILFYILEITNIGLCIMI